SGVRQNPRPQRTRLTFRSAPAPRRAATATRPPPTPPPPTPPPPTPPPAPPPRPDGHAPARNPPARNAPAHNPSAHHAPARHAGLPACHRHLGHQELMSLVHQEEHETD